MMDLRIILIILSGILAAMSSLPYLIDVVKHKTKPRIATWTTWTVMKIIACVAALIDHQYVTSILLLISLTGTLSIVILGWEFGDRKISHVDTVCLIGVVIGLILWFIFNSPAVAVLAAIVIDLIGGIPTIIHSWKNPHEETWTSFLVSFFAATFMLSTVTEWRIAAYAFPMYLVIANMSFLLLILIRRRFTEK